MKKQVYIFISFIILLLCSCSKECEHLSVVDDLAVKATCTKQGLTAGAHCETCGKVLLPQLVIEPLGHDYSKKVKNTANCTSDGEITYKCSRCDETITKEQKALGHDFSKLISSNEANCTKDGKIIYQCSRCDETSTQEQKALGHSYDSNGFCTRCNTFIYNIKIGGNLMGDYVWDTTSFSGNVSYTITTTLCYNFTYKISGNFLHFDFIAKPQATYMLSKYSENIYSFTAVLKAKENIDKNTIKEVKVFQSKIYKFTGYFNDEFKCEYDIELSDLEDVLELISKEEGFLTIAIYNNIEKR